MSLTDSKVLEPAKDLNVTVLADKQGGRIVIRGKSSTLLRSAFVRLLIEQRVDERPPL